MSNTESTVAKIINPKLVELGFELVDIKYTREGGRWFLRIFIDQPEGIGLEDCQLVSENIDTLLDEYDPIPHAYTLEVSSPGLDRPLKKPADFARFTGESVKITTFAPFAGRRKFKGQIIAAEEHSVTLNIDGTSIVLPLEQVASARLVPEF
ncbi:Ribosome maturation factor RimP [Sporotomaculum syntrophicum]|uniref:Ribosome maturation factor RimP n=1 Tax=Sporotomaculum syntrophicum TaxID=182264 RepID=A0A9D3AVT8_9FIRM|nr:ribosome maturation factor RimP [Sporotomaculum syntrophicum]KAF1084565.1 Ribosome maturation factor RimP [Sporotomaculum syntrophicum]